MKTDRAEMDRTRLISTVAIWTAATVMIVGGFARMSWTGLGGVIWASAVCALFASAGYATNAVWTLESRADGNRSDRDDA